VLRIPILLKKLKAFVKGEKILDLTRASIAFKREVRVSQAIQVTQDLAMRPDIIAKVAYGDSGMLDFILKFNEISNPFSIQEGDILFVPDLNDMKECFITSPVEIYPSLNPVNAKAKLIAVKNLSKKDQKRLEYLKLIATDPIVNPNEALPGTSETTIRNGVIIFGADNTKQECKEPISRVKLKEKLLQQSIFKS